MNKEIELISLDMRKSNNHNHPDINNQDQYLCLISDRFFAGSFCKVHYGLCFNNWYGGPLQFDAPGYNHSNWQQIWKIKTNGDKVGENLLNNKGKVRKITLNI